MKKFRLITLLSIFFISAALYSQENYSYYKSEGIDAFNRENYYKALGKFEKGIKMLEETSENDPEIYYLAGFSANKIKEYDRAIELLNIAKEKNYNGLNVDFYIFLSNIHLENNSPNKAAETLDLAFKKYKGNDKLKNEMIRVLNKGGKSKYALKFFDEEINKNRKDEELIKKVLNIYKKNNDFKNTEKYCKMLIKIKPNNINYNYELAALYYNKGVDLQDNKKLSETEFQKSLPLFEKMYELDPTNKNAIDALLILYERFNEKKKLKKLNKALKK